MIVLCTLFYNNIKKLCREFNIYSATVPDRMHHLDLGLFSYQLQLTRDLLKSSYGQALIDKMDERFSKIPRYPNLKIFKNGLKELNRFTAHEYRNMMQVCIFVIDNIIDDGNSKISKDLSELYYLWNKMYMISRSESFNESLLNEFEVNNYLYIFLLINFKESTCQ